MVSRVSPCGTAPSLNKALLEKAVIESGLDYAIARPTVIFGPEGILVNNIAWFVRKFPVFALAGSGDYGIQPIFVEDMASLCIELAHQKENKIVDAVGPEMFRFIDLVTLIRDKTRGKAAILRVSPAILLMLSRILGRIVGDVVLTPEEIEGLMANLLVSSKAPLGKMRFTDWLEQNKATLGVHYASEIERHY